MLKRLTVAAFAAAITLAPVAAVAQSGAPEPPKGATPSDNPGASSGGGSADKGAAPMMKKSSSKKMSKKKKAM